MQAMSFSGISPARMSQYTEIIMILVFIIELVSHKHETTSLVQNSVMGVIFSLLGQIIQERGWGPARWDLRPLGIPVSLPLKMWGSCVREMKFLRGSSCLKSSKFAYLDLCRLIW